MPRKKTENDAPAVPSDSVTAQAPQSGPKSVSSKKTPALDISPAEIEKRIVELANQGYGASDIGRILRDQNGVASIKSTTGHTINDLLQQHQLAPEIPEDLMALIRRVVTLDRHMTQNKKDFTAKRGYQLTVSKIRRLVHYYHAKKRLPADWRYSIEKARLLVK